MTGIQLLSLEEQVERLQTQVKSSEERVSETKREAEGREQVTREEAERDRRERERAKREREKLRGVVSEQETELQRRQTNLSELCLERETLELTISNQDGTISSLRSQVRRCMSNV